MAKNHDIKSMPDDKARLTRRKKVQAFQSIPTTLSARDTDPKDKGRNGTVETKVPFVKTDDKEASYILNRDRRPPKGMAKAGQDHFAAPRDATRRATIEQIMALKDSIHKNLKQIAGLVERREYDKAAMICGLVAQKRGQILGQAERLDTLMKSEPAPEKIPARKATTKTTVKQKRFNRWSEK